MSSASKYPPKKGRYKELRIIGGTLHNVMTEHGKIVEDLGPVKKDQPSEQASSKIVDSDIQSNNISNTQKEQEYTSGLQLVSDDDTRYRRHDIVFGDVIKPKVSTSEDIKKSKIPTWEDIQSKIPEPDPDRKDAPQNQISNIHLTPVSTEDLDKILVSDINKLPDTSIANQISGPTKVAEPISISEPKIIEHVPISEPKIIEQVPVTKPPEVPKITIPKVKINVPQKDVKGSPTYVSQVDTSNKLGDIYSTSGTYVYTKPNETEAVGAISPKADNGIKFQQPKANIEKSKIKERRISMADADELEAELLNERKFEEWLKKQKFRENLEKAARFAEETKTQFEEVIPELSGKIEGITGEVKGVENRLGTVDKSVGELCTGVDCIKNDVKKYQESQEALEKMVQEKFQELGEKVQSLEHPTFTCENCGQSVIAPLSSYCPNCGSPIHTWNDEGGNPIRGWVPYWKKMGSNEP